MSQECDGRGLDVGPALDTRRSHGWDLLQDHIFDYVLWLVNERRVRFLALQPSLGTMCYAAPPRARSTERGCREVALLGRCLCLCAAAQRADVLCMMELNPSNSAGRVAAFRRLKRRGARAVVARDCAFGDAPCRARLLVFSRDDVAWGGLARRCT